jgi:hypothetical protein
LYFFYKHQEVGTIILHILLGEERLTDERNKWVITDVYLIKDVYNTVLCNDTKGTLSSTGCVLIVPERKNECALKPLEGVREKAKIRKARRLGKNPQGQVGPPWTLLPTTPVQTPFQDSR